ncbi:hypothetical protein HYS29_00765 [Candidatus Microgenomates bacterium]|nr:hypothetical protein [Candidatus Microgenomates bacterium]MBI2622458.1 hypothetical protein [Candidatus Microgenomates bacterium]
MGRSLNGIKDYQAFIVRLGLVPCQDPLRALEAPVLAPVALPVVPELAQAAVGPLVASTRAVVLARLLAGQVDPVLLLAFVLDHPLTYHPAFYSFSLLFSTG